jgi:hypothetical protein
VDPPSLYACAWWLLPSEITAWRPACLQPRKGPGASLERARKLCLKMALYDRRERRMDGAERLTAFVGDCSSVAHWQDSGEAGAADSQPLKVVYRPLDDGSARRGITSLGLRSAWIVLSDTCPSCSSPRVTGPVACAAEADSFIVQKPAPEDGPR